MQKKIKILFFGNDYFGGQFLQTIIQNHADKFEVAGISTNLYAQKVSVQKKIKKAKILFKKKIFFSELREKIIFGDIINQKLLKNPPPVYDDIKVKDIARQYQIPVFDSSVVYAGDVEKINSFKADYIIVASFGRIPASVYNDKHSCVINFHPSFLPELRGSCPVYSAIIKRYEDTGFSFHLLSQKFDAGTLLFQEKVSIDPNKTCRELEIEIISTAANKLPQLLNDLMSNSITPIDITGRKITNCFRSYEISSVIKHTKTNTEQVVQQIKACTSWGLGAAYIQVGHRLFYITDAIAVPFERAEIKRDIDYINDYGLVIKTADGIMLIKTIYYKKEFFSGAEILKLKNRLF